MGTLTEFLFMLSSEERMSILEYLKTERMKLTQLSKKLNITITEASRHLQKLSDNKLISRDSDGFYILTGLGKVAISQIPNLSFITDHSEYFLSHDPTTLPYQFLNRLGELTECRFDSDTGRNVNHSAQMVKDADESAWVMTYQFPVLTTSTIEKRLDEGLGFRFIFPNGVQPPEGIRLDVFKRCSMRSIPRIDTRVILTDKEAQFSLPFADGRSDYSAFISCSEKFRQWSKDLFEYYWGKGKNYLS